MSEKKARAYRLTAASSITPKMPIFMWHERIPIGTIAIAAGRGGEGKSSFAIWLASQLSRGTLAGIHMGYPRDTLYISGEDSWAHTMLPRLIAAGADLSRIHRLDILTPEGTETSPILPVDVELLRNALDETGGALVVIDPLLSAMSGDTYKAAEMRQGLEPLKRVVEDAAAVALGILHFGKAAHSHAGNAINGSTAFRDVARSVFLFARDPENDVRVMSQDKNSYARDDLPSLEYSLESTEVTVPGGIADVGRFTWLGESTQTVRDLMHRGEDDEHEDRSEAERWLVHQLQDNGGSAPSADILRAARKDGFSDRTIQRTRKKVASSSKSGYQGAWIWTLELKGDAKATKTPPPEARAPLASLPSLRREGAA